MKFPVTLQPDFLVCRPSGVEIVDVMREDELEESARKHPGLYVKDEAGTWHCPAAEAWAAERGFTYQILTGRDIDPVLVKNWLSLADAAAADRPDEAVLVAIGDRVRAQPGVTKGTLAREGFDIFALKWALAHSEIYTDLTRHVIDEGDHTPLYSSHEVAMVLEPKTPASWAIGGEAPDVIDVQVGTHILWGESPAQIAAVSSTSVWLATSTGTPTELKRDGFEMLWRSGSIRSIEADRPDLETAAKDVALERYRRGGRQGLETALERLKIVEAFEEAKANPLHPGWSTSETGKRRFDGRAIETIEEWVRERNRLLAATGDRLAGLVPAANSGNQLPRLDARVMAIFAEVAKELYASPDRRTIRSVVNEVIRRCKLEKLDPPHRRTLRDRLKKLPVYDTARARLGGSAAYGLEPFSPIDPEAPLPNGAFPNQVFHCDHTIADLETIDRESRAELGRLYLSRGFDGATGRECVHLWSYDQPNSGTILRLLLRYAERFGRLPEVIVLDKDPAHRAVELLAFCEAFAITIIWRRTRKGRDGWRVERPFGTLNQDLFYPLAGNTQASRNPRQLTKENNPRLRTVYDLVKIDELYRQVRDARDERFDPLLSTSAKEAWDEGIATHGVGRLVRVDDRLRFLAMPYADGVTRQIHPTKGVVVGYLRYEAPDFGDAEVAHQRGEVRVDPDDASRVVVLVAGRLIVARCRAIAHFRVISRNELALLSERIRRDERLAPRLQTRFESDLAEILAKARDWERTQRGLQAKAIRDAAAAERKALRQPVEGAPEAPDPITPIEPENSYWERQWSTSGDPLEKAS